MTDALHTLLAGSIDYAGLFPPAALDLPTAVRNYAEYRAGADAWALGRFVVPSARLVELERAVESLAPAASAAPWRLSVLLGADPAAELEALGELNCRHAAEGATALSGDVVEARAGSVEAVERLLSLVPRWATAYVEVPLEPDPAPLVAAIARKGGRAKARTGGVTPDAFPPPGALLRFLRAVTDADVPFKLTAGLHHPLRAEYRLTYAADSPRGTMYGFLNVFLAAAFLRGGLSDAEALQLLEERAPDAFRFTPDAIRWRDRHVSRDLIAASRARGIGGFGSCSFTEPVEELKGITARPLTRSPSRAGAPSPSDRGPAS
jgi:hypothetical protein